MPSTSTNRERAGPFRGHRHYFQRPTYVGAWKIRLTVFALLATLGWVAASMVKKDQVYADASHGPLTHAHAGWDSKCEACHVPFGSEDNKAASVFAVRDRWRSFRCEGCHAGPTGDVKNYAPHYSLAHGAQDDKTARDCSSCHHDHQGKDFSLTRISDSACVRCHRDLLPLHPDKETATPITRFDRERHPQFHAVEQADPAQRTFKFSHALHLSLGVAHSAEDAGKHGLTPAKLEGKEQQRYQAFTATGSKNDPIRLDCAACHTSKGDYYAPVSFEQSCQACHALEVSSLKSTAGLSIEKFNVPHGLQPAELARFVRGEITRQVFASSKLKLDPLPLPDRLDSPREVPLPAEFASEVDSLVRKVNELLYNLPIPPKGPFPDVLRSTLRGGHACLKCHDSQAGATAFDLPKAIAKPNSPAVWLPRGRFNHSAHVAIQCAACHADKKAEYVDPIKRIEKESIGIPGIDNCVQCHKPASQGGVRDSCIDCHRYHAGGSPLREIPAERRLTIEQFLEGARPGRGP